MFINSHIATGYLAGKAAGDQHAGAAGEGNFFSNLMGAAGIGG